jgi:hypothetical protein
MIGPGKYDDLCTYVRVHAKAAGAIVIVFDGEHGPGFSCQLPPMALHKIATVLRTVAKEIEHTDPRDPRGYKPEGQPSS